MAFTSLLLLLTGLAVGAFLCGRARAQALGRAGTLHSLPDYYGYFAALCAVLPPLIVLILWAVFDERAVLALLATGLPDSPQAPSPGQVERFLDAVRQAAADLAVPADPVLAAASEHYLHLGRSSRWLLSGLVLLLGVTGIAAAWRIIHPAFQARHRVETAIRGVLLAASGVAVLTTVGIVVALLSEALHFFREVPVRAFLFDTAWSPPSVIRDERPGSVGRFGMLPLFGGTLLIAVIAMAVAIPIGILSALYTAEYAAGRVRAMTRPILNVLAGVPTVVYGFFALLVLAPWIRRLAESLGLDVAADSALTAGLVVAFMIVPLVSSLSDEAIRAVPARIREGAQALGATRSEIALGIVLPAAWPGIVGGILLAVSRAVGETVIVLMVVGSAAPLSFNPFESVTSMTVQITTLLVGGQAVDSPRTLAAFALGLVLFIVTLLLNVVGLGYVRRHRERYE